MAGRGTRFLPATKASPKEMLPVVDKPLIQYAVEEALAAGARRLVFITGSSKRAIEDHFDSDQELEHMLESQGKSDLLNSIRSVLPSYATCIYIRQPAPLGLGHAVLCAQPAVGAEPFFVHLADDLIRSEVPCLKQMADVYHVQALERARRRGGAAQGHRPLRHRRARGQGHGNGAHAQHRREAQAGRCAVDARRGGAICPHAGDLRAPRAHRARARAARSS